MFLHSLPLLQHIDCTINELERGRNRFFWRRKISHFRAFLATKLRLLHINCVEHDCFATFTPR